MVKPITEEDNLIRLRDEIMLLLEYLHDRHEPVSLNTLKSKFPVASRRQEILENKGVSFLLINKNKYCCYNKYLSGWRPIQHCPKFRTCSVPICPLDSNMRKRVYVDGEPKCQQHKEWSNGYDYSKHIRE